MDAPKPRTDLALDFLQIFRPEGPWVLAAIDPERKKQINGGTFQAEEEGVATARKWIDEFQGERNLYFHVNPLRKVVDVILASFYRRSHAKAGCSWTQKSFECPRTP